MAFDKGKLMVEGNIYKKKISTSRSMLLHMDDDTLKQIHSVDSVSREVRHEQGSQFRAFAAKTSTLNQLQTIHMHFKRKYSEATHVMIAYKVAGLNMAYDEDYLDDGEISAGWKILSIINDLNADNITVVVIRHYGGQWLDGLRFEIIDKAVRKAVSQLQKGEVSTSKLPLSQMLKMTRRTPPFRWQRKFSSIYPRGGHRGGSNARFASAEYKQILLWQVINPPQTIHISRTGLTTRPVTSRTWPTGTWLHPRPQWSDTDVNVNRASASNLCPLNETDGQPWKGQDDGANNTTPQEFTSAASSQEDQTSNQGIQAKSETDN